MTNGRLTKRTIDAARPRASRFCIWDGDLPGFGLRIEATGRKTFIARYRAFDERKGGRVLRQAVLGRYGTLTVEQGRAAARKLLGAAAAGGDPVRARKDAEKAGITVADVCDWYLKEGEAGRLLRRNGRPIKASTLESDKGRIKHHIKPLIGDRAVRGLSVRDMETMQADIAAGKTAAPRPKKGKRPRGGIATGGGGVAARTLALAQAIFGHAKRAGLIDENPASGARKGAQKKHKERLTYEALRALGEAMRTSGENATAIDAARFILMTGFRRNEALKIQRDWLIPGGVDLPDTKAGPQARAIGRKARELLDRRLRDNNHLWAFPSDTTDRHFVGLPKVLRRLAKLAKIKRVTVHLLRHTFASVAGDLGMSELVIAGLMGHSAGSVTAGYVHLDAALVHAADRVAAAIARALDGKGSAQVIPLQRDRLMHQSQG